MNRWTDDIRAVLERAPTGALPLSSIGRELKREGVTMDPRDPWVLASLKKEQRIFRVIPFHPGPWKVGAEMGGMAAGREDPWILLRKTPDQGFGRRARVRAKIQDGVRAWARGLDPSSPVGVARWIRATMEGGRICTALVVGEG